jgi:hypothetical protein
MPPIFPATVNSGVDEHASQRVRPHTLLPRSGAGGDAHALTDAKALVSGVLDTHGDTHIRGGMHTGMPGASDGS